MAWRCCLLHLFLLCLVKSSKSLKIIELLITWSNVAFFYFQYGFRSSQSTADLLTVVSDRIARAFNRSGATRAVALDISKAFGRVWHAGLLLQKISFYVISGQAFDRISSFLTNRRLRVVLDRTSSQGRVPEGSILGPTLSYYTLMTFLMMLSGILQSMPMILLSTLSVRRHMICGNN